MSQPLSLAALLAWILIQVPLVACESACSSALVSALLLDGHACHEEESDEHRVRCRHGCDDHTTTEHSDDVPPEDDQGVHVILQVQALGTGVPAAVPAHTCEYADPAAPACELLLSPRPDRVTDIRRDPAPPLRPDPVSAADRLVV